MRKRNDGWDEDEDEPTHGPEPERLNTDLSPEELARRVLRGGKPKPGDLEDEDMDDDEG